MITEKPITEMLAPRQRDLISLMGGEMQVKKEISFAIQACNANSMLANVNQASIAKAIYNVAITGLSLNPVHKLAYLVPKKIAGQWEAVLFPSYQGLVKLITDAGIVSRIEAHPVYEGDEFDYSLGLETTLSHKPKGISRNLMAVYAIAVMKDGSKQVEVMWRSEVDEIMMRSDSGKNGTGPWKTDYNEMARKTVLRRIYKYLPKSVVSDKIAEAIALDEQDYPATIGQIGYIETLLQTSNIDHDERSRINRSLSEMTSEEAGRMIEYLQDNQLDKISAGLAYNQGDIAAKVKAEILTEEGGAE